MLTEGVLGFFFWGGQLDCLLNLEGDARYLVSRYLSLLLKQLQN